MEQEFSEVAPASGFCYLGCSHSGGGVEIGADFMRRVVLILLVMAAALVLASGVALAVTKIGSNGPDTLRGTNGDDDLLGRGGQDNMFSLDGTDNLIGEAGRDNV